SGGRVRQVAGAERGARVDETAARQDTRQMKRLATPLFCAALALFSYFVIPGHTWLQQDSQIYVPILEHERDSSVLRNDILVQRSHVAYTLYDEAAVMLRAATGLGFHEVLAAQQIVTRALGIWGLMMLAGALGLAWGEVAGAGGARSRGAGGGGARAP